MTDSTANTEDEGVPMVAGPSVNNRSMYIFWAILLVGGASLFSALNANRVATTAPATTATSDNSGAYITSPAPLRIPRAFIDGTTYTAERDTRPVMPESTPEKVSPAAPVQVITALPVSQIIPSQPIIAPSSSIPEPVVVFREPNSSIPRERQAQGDSNDRVRASRFEHPAVTIPKGTVIHAVLETALDSTRPGGVRALVQRSIYGFDGSRVLIQRGSRLIGEYDADLQSGQNRALIQWTRLVRPDGVIIALDSPASDPLGRAGVKGKVDNKFLQRFGGAILQSILDIGVGIATRHASDGVIVALPGATQQINSVQKQDIKPTLTVKHGTSVSVFVARDLDFSSVDL